VSGIAPETVRLLLTPALAGGAKEKQTQTLACKKLVHPRSDSRVSAQNGAVCKHSSIMHEILRNFGH
jgi:hypothetical protein